MQVDYFDILVRPVQRGSAQKLAFWAIANVAQNTSPYTHAILMWGTVGGATRHQSRGWMSPVRRRALVRKKRGQYYFSPDNPTIAQVLAQLEQHMIWLALKS